LVTGAKGFIGKNLCLELKNRSFNVFEFDKNNSSSDLSNFVSSADFIVHLAGVNRSLSVEEFSLGNAHFTFELIDTIKQSGRLIPLIFTSSIQVSLNTDYGKTKKEAEDFLLDFSKNTGNPVFIYRLSNAFGKWSVPNYNSVIATFCYNISHNIDIKINNPEAETSFVYIDDIVNDFIELIRGTKKEVCMFPLEVIPIYKVKVGDIAKLLYLFKNSRENFTLPNISGEFERKLFATYLSYLDPKDFSYPLSKHIDGRGSFAEFLKAKSLGQISINVSKPGMTKGNHWHQSKIEKFLVVYGEASIKLRKVGTHEVMEYKVSGDELRVVDIPCGYTHNITNTGQNDLVMIMWADELFNPSKPDTYSLEVIANE